MTGYPSALQVCTQYRVGCSHEQSVHRLLRADTSGLYPEFVPDIRRRAVRNVGAAIGLQQRDTQPHRAHVKRTEVTPHPAWSFCRHVMRGVK